MRPPPVAETLEGRHVLHEEYTVRGHGGDEIVTSVFRSPLTIPDRGRPSCMPTRVG